MIKDTHSSQHANITHDYADVDGVCFDPEHVTLEGAYTDELSLHRAKKVWVETLKQSFLLEKDHDFKLIAIPILEQSRFVLKCEFITACARYAFWRLTNNQAPEAQYIIETAHIPNSASRQEDFWTAPDLRAKASALTLSNIEQAILNNQSSSQTLTRVIKSTMAKLFGRKE